MVRHLLLVLALFIFLRLRNVLGQPTGSERSPFDRTARNAVQGAPDNNVVPIPGKIIDQAPLAPSADVTPPSDRWKGLAEPVQTEKEQDRNETLFAVDVLLTGSAREWRPRFHERSFRQMVSHQEDLENDAFSWAYYLVAGARNNRPLDCLSCDL